MRDDTKREVQTVFSVSLAVTTGGNPGSPFSFWFLILSSWFFNTVTGPAELLQNIKDELLLPHPHFKTFIPCFVPNIKFLFQTCKSYSHYITLVLTTVLSPNLGLRCPALCTAGRCWLIPGRCWTPGFVPHPKAHPCWIYRIREADLLLLLRSGAATTHFLPSNLEIHEQCQLKWKKKTHSKWTSATKVVPVVPQQAQTGKQGVILTSL